MRLLALLILLFAAPAQADGIEVDVELALMVDVSRSMTPNELEIQRQGYAAALRSDAVYAAIQNGLLQRIALTYVEWAGDQRVIVDWRIVQTRDDLTAFADRLTAKFDPALRRTSISSAIGYAARSIRDNPFAGLRRVIDISGDGPNNQGIPVLEARDAALAQGLTINGLPLMTREGMGTFWHLDDLDLYYRDCVIGGPGAFAIPVLNWEDFAAAVQRKLVLEIAGLPTPGPTKAQYRYSDSFDCLIGEKMWEQRRRYWDEP